MKRSIYSIATTALLAGIVTIGFTPAGATISPPDREHYLPSSSATPVHGQKAYHCNWRGSGANRTKHCHICG